MFRSLCALMLLAAGSPADALPVRYQGGTAAQQAAVDSTQAAIRLGSLQQAEGFQFWARRLSRDAPTVLESLGYYDARLSAELTADQQIVIDLEPGQPVLISHIVLGFSDPSAAPELPFPLAIGSPLEHALYESGKGKIHAELISDGYLAAELTEHRIEVDRTARTATISLFWNTGTQYQFGGVSFDGTDLAPDFLQRYVAFAPGDFFSQSALQRLNQSLRDSHYFSTVEVSPQLDQAGTDLQVPIAVTLSPVARSIYEFGLSLGSDRGVGAEFEAERNLLNSRGHRAEARAEVATRRSFAAARYEMPALNLQGQTRLLDINWIDEETDSSERQSSRLAYSVKRPWLDWQRTDSLSLLNERYLIADQREESAFLIGSLELFQLNADNPINPSAGWRGRGKLALASSALGSATDFIQAELSYKYIASLGPSNRWLMRARAGGLWANEFDQLPASLRFYAGGDNSVRGFDFEALGPRDADGNVLGGEFVLDGSVEFDRQFRPGWRWATFVDAGNAFGTGSEQFEYSAGLGIRWLSPVGPLRLDIAKPLSSSDGSWRLHFSAGPDL